MPADKSPQLFGNPFTLIATPACTPRLLELVGMVFLTWMLPFAFVWSIPRITGWYMAVIRDTSTGNLSLPDWRQPLWQDGVRAAVGMIPWHLAPLPLFLLAVLVPGPEAKIIVTGVLLLCYLVWSWAIAPLVLITVALTRRMGPAWEVRTMLGQLRAHGPRCIAISALLYVIGLLATGTLFLSQGLAAGGLGSSLLVSGLASLDVAHIALLVFQYLIVQPFIYVFSILAAGLWFGRLAQQYLSRSSAPAPHPLTP